MKKLQNYNYPALIKLYHATLLPSAVQHSPKGLDYDLKSLTSFKELLLKKGKRKKT